MDFSTLKTGVKTNEFYSGGVITTEDFARVALIREGDVSCSYKGCRCQAHSGQIVLCGKGELEVRPADHGKKCIMVCAQLPEGLVGYMMETLTAPINTMQYAPGWLQPYIAYIEAQLSH